jgi:hypothetical protein
MSVSDKAVLDREYATQTAAHFGDALHLINELVDYGTSLVPLAFINSPRDLKAICIIFVQLRQFLVHLEPQFSQALEIVRARRSNADPFWRPH